MTITVTKKETVLNGNARFAMVVKIYSHVYNEISKNV